MGVERTLVPSVLNAVRGLWAKVDWSNTRATMRLYPNGSDGSPGSDNHSTLAWGVAIVVAAVNAPLLRKLGTTVSRVVEWWEDELTTRLLKGLQLKEERSRIYVVWEAFLICVLRPYFAGFHKLDDLHLKYVKAAVAQAALSAFPVRPKRLDPPAEDKALNIPVFCTLAGARSHEQKGDNTHHKLVSGWEFLLATVLGYTLPSNTGSQITWARELVRAIRPRWMGLTSFQRSLVRDVVEAGSVESAGILFEWLDGVGTMWPATLVRFERRAATLGEGRAINANTAPVYAMTVDEKGTVRYLVLDTGSRSGVNPEPVRVLVSGDGAVRDYNVVAGGEDLPKKNMLISSSEPDHSGRVLWEIRLRRGGDHEWRFPREEKEPPAPVPPGPGPVPPGPGPEPPAPPRDDDERDWYDYPGLWLTKLWRWLQERF